MFALQAVYVLIYDEKKLRSNSLQNILDFAKKNYALYIFSLSS